MDLASTIIARASGPGAAARAILRVSGEGCLALLGPDTAARRGVHRLRFEGVPVLAYVTPGPRSFTGEDSFELLVAGNDDLLACVESAVEERAEACALACRRAAPGEFSLRAFLHGRIDLTQAEGIAATIAATTEAELRAARELVQGRLGEEVRSLADRVARDLALVEAGIDFTDQEDVVAIPPDELLAHTEEALTTLRALLAGSGGRERVEALPVVLLAGRPNAGKSTLFNALLGRPRAVATPIAGTTRDLLAERLTLPTPEGSLDILLIDAAGVDEERPAINGLDAQARSAAQDAIARSELVLRCVATDAPRALDARTGELVVRTKADLPLSGEEFGAVAVCAQDGRGLTELRDAIARRLTARLAAPESERLILGTRHREALLEAQARLEEARSLVAVRGLADPELVASMLRLALDELGSITGAIAPDDVLGRIFASFCVGK